MATYTVTLTDAEDKAIHTECLDAQFWVQNVIKERARIAMESIVHTHVKTQLQAGEPLAGTTHEEIVLALPLKSVRELNDSDPLNPQ